MSTIMELIRKSIYKIRTDGVESFLRSARKYGKNRIESFATINRARAHAYYRIKRRIYYNGRPPNDFVTNHEYRSYSVGSNPTFFGYFDVSPFDDSDSRMLCCYKCGEELTVGYINIEQEQFNEIGKTKTWSWQQGCRLQWLTHDKVIYNRHVENESGAVIYDTETESVIKKLSNPIYSVANGFAFSFDFARLYSARDGYGYRTSSLNSTSEDSPRDNGLLRTDIETGETEVILSLQDLAKHERCRSMDGAYHWINHVFPNESSNRLTFLHRWGDGNKWDTRLVVTDFEGDNLTVVEDTGEPSHMTWQAPDRILATVIRSGQTEYAIYDASSGQKEDKIKNIDINGHPSYSSNGVLATDTNPNAIGERKLLFKEENDLVPIATVFGPWMGEDRCDLHPRWDSSGSKICIDSEHTGQREMHVFTLSGQKTE